MAKNSPLNHPPRPQLERQRRPPVVARVELRPVRRQPPPVVHVHRVPDLRLAFALDFVRLLDAEVRGRGGRGHGEEGEEDGEAHCCSVCTIGCAGLVWLEGGRRGWYPLELGIYCRRGGKRRQAGR